MVQAPHTRLLSIEEFLQLPEESPALELIDGIVERKPVGTIRHARAARRLLRLLEAHPATRDGEGFVELGQSFAGRGRSNHRVPDLSWYAHGVTPDGSDHPVESPDLVAEVHSPGQGRQLLEDRLRFLIDNGARVALLVDPERKSVTVYERSGETRTFEPGEVCEMAALGGFAFDPADLFA
ncbi:MAG: Uma2 family endonuclease [Dehalococcoidia bacterium]|nr:Uma2 family endonuclease [Dehalococcoidia bacterium]